MTNQRALEVSEGCAKALVTTLNFIRTNLQPQKSDDEFTSLLSVGISEYLRTLPPGDVADYCARMMANHSLKAITAAILLSQGKEIPKELMNDDSFKFALDQFKQNHP